MVSVSVLAAVINGGASAQNLAEVFAKVRPAVVTITAASPNGKSISQGSGFIVGANGVILTAWHVVSHSSVAAVTLSTGEIVSVKGVLRKDANKDLALLFIDKANLPTVELGDSDKVQQGDRILTLGSPVGLDGTAAEGIVSAIRDLQELGTHIQFTAAISPGSSGGPLLNVNGEAVGVAVFKLTKGQELNFAVAINEAKDLLSRPQVLTPLSAEIQQSTTTHRDPPQETTDQNEIVSRKVLTSSDLRGKSVWQLTVLRNTPYARHGYKFHVQALRDYFSQQNWYHPTTSEMTVVEKRLNATERRNCQMILQYQKAHGLTH